MLNEKILFYASIYNEGHWQRFVAFCEREVGKMHVPPFNKPEIPHDIEVVVQFTFGEGAKSWMYHAVPALDNAVPIELMRDPVGIQGLKAALLRVPD